MQRLSCLISCFCNSCVAHTEDFCNPLLLFCNLGYCFLDWLFLWGWKAAREEDLIDIQASHLWDGLCTNIPGIQGQVYPNTVHRHAVTKLDMFRTAGCLKHQVEAHVYPQLLQNMAMLMSITWSKFLSYTLDTPFCPLSHTDISKTF